MPGSWRPDTQEGFARETRDRLAKLERKNRTGPMPDETEVAVFSLTGEVVAGDPSGPWRVRRSGYVASVGADLATADTADIVVDILLDAVSIGTVTIPLGTTSADEYFGAVVARPGARLQVEVTDPGDGAGTGLVVKIWIRSSIGG